MSSINIPSDVNSLYDVIIVGGGIAGAIFANRLRNLSSDISIAIVERDYLGSHEPSYYVPKSFIETLNLQELVIQQINEFSYEIDVSDYVSPVNTNGDIFVVPYLDVCEKLTDNISIIHGEFIEFNDRSRTQLIVEIDGTKEIFSPKVIIDCTGWESKLRSANPFLRKPEFGCSTYLIEMRNCSQRAIDWNKVIITVGDYAGYFWMEPNETEDGKTKLGVGIWCDLEDETKLEELKERMLLFIDKYQDKFEHAYIENEYFAKIAADPVRNIVYNNTIYFGEAAGMTNPYWLLGSAMYLNHAEKFAPVVVDYINGIESLNRIQGIWEEKLSEYGKLWAGARVMWKEDAAGWEEILDRRTNLKEFTTSDQTVERQSGGTYSLAYLRKMWGWKRLLKASYFLMIYKLRMRSSRFYNYFKIKQRDNFVDVEQDEYLVKIERIKLLLSLNKLRPVPPLQQIDETN